MDQQRNDIKNRRPKLVLSPEKEARAERLQHLFWQFEDYPENGLPADMIVTDIVELLEAVLLFWSPERRAHRQAHLLDELLPQARSHFDTDKIEGLATRTDRLLAQIKVEQLARLNSPADFELAATMFKLGFLFNQLDHENAEHEAIARHRDEMRATNAAKGPASAIRRAWWKLYWQSAVETFLLAHPRVTNATEIARQVLPEINARKRAGQAPLTIENLSRQVRRLLADRPTLPS